MIAVMDVLGVEKDLLALLTELLKLREETDHSRPLLEAYEKTFGVPTGAACRYCGEPIFEKDPEEEKKVRDGVARGKDFAHEKCHEIVTLREELGKKMHAAPTPVAADVIEMPKLEEG